MRYRSETALVVSRSESRYQLRILSMDALACKHCSMCARTEEGAPREMLVDASLLPWQPQPGDEVRVLVPDISSALAALVVFGIPLGAALAGLFVAARLALPDWAALGIGAASFTCGWLLSYLVWGRGPGLRFETPAKQPPQQAGRP